MAHLISEVSGNLTAVLTVWDSVETGTRAVQLTKTGSTNTTTSTVYNANAQDLTGTNLNVCEGLLMHCKQTTVTGTVKVVLSADSGTTETVSLTVNATDLPTSPSWVFFKFASPLTLDGGTDYAVGVQGSSAGNATFYRSATAADWAHLLRLDSLATAAAGDVLWVVGELTGAGASTAITVTMDSTATTDYGTGTDGASDNGMEIGNLGTLQYGTTAATNYYLKLSGSLNVWGGGTLNIGTTGTPIPRGGSAVLEFDPVADGGMGLYVQNGGIFNAQGLSRTSGKDVVSCKLNTDEAAAQTVLGVDTDTGWLNTDNIVIASTTQTSSQTELRVLSGNATATEITVSSGLTNAHSGTSPTQAEVVLLTRNVQIRSATSTIMSFCQFSATSTVDADWTEFYYLGANAAGKKGIHIFTTTGTANIQYSSVHDCERWGVFISGAGATGVTFQNNIVYKCGANGDGHINVDDESGTTTSGVVINNNYILGTTSGSVGIYLEVVALTCNNNVVVVNGVGFDLNDQSGTITSFSGNTAHSCGSTGLRISDAIISSTISNFTAWRCLSGGVATATLIVEGSNVIFDTLTLFGNSTNNIVVNSGDILNNIKVISGTLNGDSTFSTTNGLNVATGININLISCSLGVASGIKTAHTNDISIVSSSPEIIMNNCILSSATEVLSTGLTGFYVKSQKHDQTAGTHKSWFKYGIIQTDTTIADAGISQRLTPNDASNKLESGSKKVAVANAGTVTVTVKVRESVVGDGTDYNGNRIRLIVKRNDAAGITADTVLATATVTSEGAFETLSGTTAAVTDDAVLEFVCDCDGTTGWVNLDTWTTS